MIHTDLIAVFIPSNTRCNNWVYLFLNDTGRAVEAEVFLDGAGKFEIPAGAEVFCYSILPSGCCITTPCTVSSDGNIVFDIGGAVTAELGRVWNAFRIVDTDERSVSTSAFYIKVQPSLQERSDET